MPIDTHSKRSTHLGAEQWQKIIADFESSGLSQARFCKLHQIPVSTFSKWRSKLISSAKAEENPQFAQVIPIKDRVPDPASTLKVNIHNQYSLEWHESVSPSYIGQLLKVLSHAI